ncbi:hypothetical protein [Paraprevotella clara]|jgi:hypothetical protein|uniref:hypothetical protein n=1 Tax=Paraprevotella clara TaxID=454154 RepID=UPI003AB4CEBD
MKEAREKVFRKNLGLMKAAFAGKSKCGFSVQYYCLPQRRVNDFPPMTNANTDAINLPRRSNNLPASQKMSRNVFLTSQTASLKSNKAIAISGNRYMSNNSSNISQYKTAKTLVSVCKDTKNQ